MLTIEGDRFALDGKEFTVYSGAIHYFRSLPEDWEDRLAKLAAAGFNTVETYVCWNLHEPEPGRFDFSGRLDLVRFLQTAQALGLYAIVRPGPYICAEWDNGGLPAWLLAEPMKLRCSDPKYLACADRWLRALYAALAPLQQSRGGNIIALQIENEYGHYGADKAYLKHLAGLAAACGIDSLLFTSDGNYPWALRRGGLDGLLRTVNFGSGTARSLRLLRRFQKTGPLMCTEFWSGWFDHWGEAHHTRETSDVMKEVDVFLRAGASFNVYMFHGGTNFGFTAGANRFPFHGYQPDVTSYDYCAPLTEWGDYTPTYHALREAVCRARGIAPPPLPPRPALQTVGEVPLDASAGLLENLDALGRWRSADFPESMERCGQSFGLICYEKELERGGKLWLNELGDRAYVFCGGEPAARFELRGTRAARVKAGRLDVLVDPLGRVNFGRTLGQHKGLTGITLDGAPLRDMRVCTLPLEDLSGLEYGGTQRFPAFLRGHFSAKPGAACFVHTDGLAKGVVWVNGFNLGRYWSIGPQQALYLPAPLLREDNEIVVLELEGCARRSVRIDDTPALG